MRLLKQFIYLSGGEAVSKAVTFLAIAYLARIVGPAGFGYVEFASAVLLCASLIVDQGFGPYGAREIAREPERTAALASEIILARFLLAGVAYATVILFALSLDRPAVVTQLLLIYGLSLLVAPLLLQWVFQGHNRMQTVAVMQIIRQTIFATVIFAFVRSAAQVWIVGLAELAGVTGAAAFGIWMYGRRFHCSPFGGVALSRRLFREGVPIGLSQIFWMTRMFGATALLGVIGTAEDVGFFGAAMRIMVALHAFVWLYFFNLLPSMARTWQDDPGRFAILTARSMRIVAWLAGMGGLGLVSLAPTVMTGVYGTDFAPATTTFQLLVGVLVGASLSGHYRFGLIAVGHQNLEMAASAIGALIALVLVPTGYAVAGTAGAAAGLLVAEVVVWESTWRWSATRLGTRGHLSLLIRPILASLVPGLLLLLPWSSEGVRTVMAVATLGVLAVVLDSELRLQLTAIRTHSQGNYQDRPRRESNEVLW